MRKLFAVADNAVPDVVSDKSEQMVVKFWTMHTQKVESLKKLITLPEANSCCFLWTLNSFNAFTFIPYCLSHFGVIDNLSLSTYTISMKIADALFREVDEGRIKNVEIFVSESLRFRMPKVVEHIDAMIVSRPVRISYVWNHSKITCVQCGDNYLVLEGSGNWSENAQFEQYILTNSKQIYDFRKENISMVE